MLPENASDLDDLLAALRGIKGDHQWVEAKRSRDKLPKDLWTSLSALANTGGGLVLLGVDEQNAVFEVTGVADPVALMANLQQQCGSAEPPIRCVTSAFRYTNGEHVLAAQIPATPAFLQPCYFPNHGPREETSYIRVGDGDVRLTPREVNELAALQRSNDESAREAPPQAKFDSAIVAQALEPGESEEGGLRRLGAVSAAGHPTLAGWLAAGDHPETISPLARVSCLRDPLPTDPAGTVQSGHDSEGPIGHLVDSTLAWLRTTLRAVQVRKDGTLIDEFDTSLEALREALVNALVHRSFTEAAQHTPVTVHVTSETVMFSSPGGLSPYMDRRELGFGPAPTTRNHALVRICQRLTTPSGARIVESKASGIRRADDVCRQAGTAPLLFHIAPAEVTVVALRGRLDLEAARSIWGELTDDEAAVVALAAALDELRYNDPSSVLHRVPLDSYLAARLLRTRQESAASLLTSMAARGVLLQRPRFREMAWVLNQEATPDNETPTATPSVAKTSRSDKETIRGVPTRRQELARAVLHALSTTGPSRRQDLLETEGVLSKTSPRTVSTVLGELTTAGLIEPVGSSKHDPTRMHKIVERDERSA